MYLQFIIKQICGGSLTGLCTTKGPFWHFANLKKGNCKTISVPHFYHCVAVLLFKLPVGNKKHPSWRGEKGVWIFLCSEVTPLEDHISTILLQIVVTLPWVLKVFLLLLAADKWEDNWLPGYSCYPYCTSKKKKKEPIFKILYLFSTRWLLLVGLSRIIFWRNLASANRVMEKGTTMYFTGSAQVLLNS